MTSTRTFRGRDIFSGDMIELRVDDGKFAEVVPCGDAHGDVWLCPGFVDLQVNGYAGVDFNDDACDVESIAALTKRLAAMGTTTFLPTIVTASFEAMLRRVRMVVEARNAFPNVNHAVPCIHLEGPSISPLDGYRGAHPLADVREPSMAEFELLQGAAQGLIGLVTLSPHWPNSAEYIRALAKAGVVVALGHTHASPEMIRAAVDAGAQLSTHLGNGIAAQLPRHPNPLWTQLAEDRLTATLIADGVHLSADVLRTAIRAKGVERSVLVSDSVSLAGSAPGRYRSNIGQDVEVGDDGSIRMLEGGLLAGSGIALKDAVSYTAALPGITLSDAARMATTNAARFVKSKRGCMAAGALADFLRLQSSAEAGTFVILEAFVMGSAVASDNR